MKLTAAFSVSLLLSTSILDHRDFVDFVPHVFVQVSRAWVAITTTRSDRDVRFVVPNKQRGGIVHAARKRVLDFPHPESPKFPRF